MRVYISDSTEDAIHGDNVLASFLSEYNISDDVLLNKDHANYSVQNVKDDMLIAFNAGYEMFISCGYGGNNFLNEAIDYYPQMLCVFPNGTNSNIENGNYIIPEIAVICGAGDTENEAGYPIEFFDNDPITAEVESPDEADASSFSTPVIAAKLLKIKDGRGSHWTDALQSARATASLSSLDNENGYGIIAVESAIAYDGEIKLTVGELTAVRGLGSNATITLERIIDATVYDLWINGVITETTDLINEITLSGYRNHYFKYRGRNGSLTSAWSSEKIIKYNKLKYILQPNLIL